MESILSKIYSKLTPSTFFTPHRIDISTSFYNHVKTMHTWERTMTIRTFTHYLTCLITKLQQRSTMCITTDGSKTDKKSGGTWTLSTPHGQLLAHGQNPDYNIMDNMHSHRLEADEMLSVLLFFKEYFNFYSIPLQNKFKIYCDNKVITNKISMVKNC